MQVGVVSAAALAVWAILAPSATAPEVTGRAAFESVRIEIAGIALPRAEPPPPPEPPTLPAARAPAPEASPTSPAEDGSSLPSGAFPRLRATYAHIGFRAYRDAMLDLGAAFFLFDDAARRPVAAVDPSTGEMIRDLELRGLSRWPRDVTRHLPRVLERGRELLGDRVSRVVLLPPARVDAALLDALDAGLRQQGVAPGALLRVDVAYEIEAGALWCRVLAVALRDGTERPMPLRIDLSRGSST